MRTLGDLADRARSLVQGGRRAVLGVTGGPGAGKTTLAENLVRLLNETSLDGEPSPNGDTPPDGQAHADAVRDQVGEGVAHLADADRRAHPGGGETAAPHAWVAHVPMDGFHLADVELDRLGRRDRKGAPDTFDAAGYAALLRRLREDTDDVVYAPAFERDIEQPIAGSIPVPRSARLVVTEGNYLLLGDGDWARVRPMLDEVWYCDLDPDERLRRLIARHEAFGKPHDAAVAWSMGTDQRNADLIATTRPHADYIVPDATLREIGT